ncbi:MAG: hypothetical protein K9M99_03230 [Candidatus Cloacimonetes bacterium]|nr:hypothetical protein [Candidatus Cloacimonadota bacterium]
MKNILIILFALVIVMFGLVWLINRDKAAPEVLLTIILPNQEKIEISSFPADEIQVLPIGQGKSEQVVPVSYFLKTEQKWAKLTFISRDNAQLTIDKEELDSLYLSMISNGEESYLRLIIPTDDFHQRWLKYITQIELK